MGRKRKLRRISISGVLAISAILILGILAWRYYAASSQTGDFVEFKPLPKGFCSHGIDVSHHQGEINWEHFFATSDSIISFVYYKVSEGTHFVDSQWKMNRSNLSQHDMKNGGYHFFTPDISGRMQADHFLNQYTYRENDLPPVLDAEVLASTNERLITGMKEWLQQVEEETHIRPIIYTSYSMFRDIFKGKFDGYSFWIASYNPKQSRLNDPAIIHWQYTDRGSVPGIRGPVDLNFSKIDFQEKNEIDLAQ